MYSDGHSFRVEIDYSAVSLLGSRERRYSCHCEALRLVSLDGVLNKYSYNRPTHPTFARSFFAHLETHSACVPGVHPFPIKMCSFWLLLCFHFLPCPDNYNRDGWLGVKHQLTYLLIFFLHFLPTVCVSYFWFVHTQTCVGTPLGTFKDSPVAIEKMLPVELSRNQEWRHSDGSTKWYPPRRQPLISLAVGSHTDREVAQTAAPEVKHKHIYHSRDLTFGQCLVWGCYSKITRVFSLPFFSLSLSLFVCLLCLSVFLSVCQSVCLSVFLSVCLSLVLMGLNREPVLW